jgi:hypothetical protein
VRAPWRRAKEPAARVRASARVGAIGAERRGAGWLMRPAAAADGASSGVACPVTRRARSPFEGDHDVDRLGDAPLASRRWWTAETTRALMLGQDLHIVKPLPGPKRTESLA